MGASVAVAAAGSYGISVWGSRTPAANAIPVGDLGVGDDVTLVVLEMGGGNDGLNTVIPYASSRYHDLRRDLAIEDPLVLDDEIGLHPALGFVADRYASGDVAIIEGIGYPQPELSHFASMGAWWTALGDDPPQTGWLGRYLDGTLGPNDPLAGVTLGQGPSPAMRGDTSFSVIVQDSSGIAPAAPAWIDTNDELMEMWAGFAPAAFDDAPLLHRVTESVAGTVAAAAFVNPLLENVVSVEGRAGQLNELMTIAATLIAGANPPRVIMVHGWGDFDTHQAQSNRHANMLSEVNTALESFFGGVDAAGVGDRVAVMTTSEFGRRPKSNGSGTDHGTAGAQLVIGSRVAGGRFGEAPSLTQLDARGNMSHTVDFRSYYASVLDGFLGVDADVVLSQSYERMALFS